MDPMDPMGYKWSDDYDYNLTFNWWPVARTKIWSLQLRYYRRPGGLNQRTKRRTKIKDNCPLPAGTWESGGECGAASGKVAVALDLPWFMFHPCNNWSYNQPYILTDDFAAPLCMNEVLKTNHEWQTNIFDKCV